MRARSVHKEITQAKAEHHSRYRSCIEGEGKTAANQSCHIVTIQPQNLSCTRVHAAPDLRRLPVSV